MVTPNSHKHSLDYSSPHSIKAVLKPMIILAHTTKCQFLHWSLKPLEAVKAELGVSRRQSRRLSIDFGLFNNPIANDRCELNTVWLDFGAKRIRHCDQLNRLISGLKYYSNLDFKNDIDKDEFNNFFDDTYTNMLEVSLVQNWKKLFSQTMSTILRITCMCWQCTAKIWRRLWAHPCNTPNAISDYVRTQRDIS